MKFVNVYIISGLLWSLFLNYFLYEKNRRLVGIINQSDRKDVFLFMKNMKFENERIVLILSLFVSPLLLIGALIVGFLKLLKIY
jgi:hypothetical protein